MAVKESVLLIIKLFALFYNFYYFRKLPEGISATDWGYIFMFIFIFLCYVVNFLFSLISCLYFYTDLTTREFLFVLTDFLWGPPPCTGPKYPIFTPGPSMCFSMMDPETTSIYWSISNSVSAYSNNTVEQIGESESISAINYSCQWFNSLEYTSWKQWALFEAKFNLWQANSFEDLSPQSIGVMKAIDIQEKSQVYFNYNSALDEFWSRCEIRRFGPEPGRYIFNHKRIMLDLLGRAETYHATDIMRGLRNCQESQVIATFGREGHSRILAEMARLGVRPWGH